MKRNIISQLIGSLFITDESGAVPGGGGLDVAAAERKMKETKQAAKAAKPKQPAKKAAKKAKPAKKAAKKAKKAAGDKAVKGPEVLREYAANYEHNKEKKTSGGHVSVDCGDDLAAKLRGKTLEDVYSFAAKALDEPVKELLAKYKHLNVGMQRMNLGNRVRAALNAK